MAISLIVFAVVFGGALLGMALRALLPDGVFAPWTRVAPPQTGP